MTVGLQLFFFFFYLIPAVSSQRSLVIKLLFPDQGLGFKLDIHVTAKIKKYHKTQENMISLALGRSVFFLLPSSKRSRLLSIFKIGFTYGILAGRTWSCW